jgi:hypothetical protein
LGGGRRPRIGAGADATEAPSLRVKGEDEGKELGGVLERAEERAAGDPGKGLDKGLVERGARGRGAWGLLETVQAALQGRGRVAPEIGTRSVCVDSFSTRIS